jgi:hypothetical protein
VAFGMHEHMQITSQASPRIGLNALLKRFGLHANEGKNG